MRRRVFLIGIVSGTIYTIWRLGRRETLAPEIVLPTPIPAARPVIISRAEWQALPPDHDARGERGLYHPQQNRTGWRVYESPLDEIYRTVVIHHAALYEGNDLDSVLEVQRWHREVNHWADVGYHYLVGRTGAIYEGRPIHVRGAHVGGFNTGSVGLCLLGHYMRQQPTEAQLLATIDLTRWLTSTLQLTHLAGHFEFNADTVCPGDNILPYLTQFADSAGLVHGTDGYDDSQA